METVLDALKLAAVKQRSWCQHVLRVEPEDVVGGRTLYERAIDEIEMLTAERDVTIANVEQLEAELSEQIETTGRIMALTAERDEALNRVTVLETELACAAVLLQEVLPVGKCKALGLLEVAAAVEYVTTDLDDAREDAKEWQTAARVLGKVREKLTAERDEARAAAKELLFDAEIYAQMPLKSYVHRWPWLEVSNE